MTDDASETDIPRPSKGRRLKLRAEAGHFKIGQTGVERAAPPLFDVSEPEWRAKVEAIRNEFEAKAAELIFRFAAFDGLLFELFNSLLAKDAHIAAMLYYRNEYFAGRLRLVDQMVQLCIANDSAFVRWKALSKAMKEIAKTRNLVAHRPFNVSRLVQVGPDGASKRIFLGASHAAMEHVADPRRDVWWHHGDEEEAMRVDLAGLKRVLRKLETTHEGVVQFTTDLSKYPNWRGYAVRAKRKL